MVQRPDRIRAKDNEDPVLDLARGYVRERVSRYIWRLAVGNCCALCLEPCTDDTFELAHVHGDGNQERKRSHPHGAEKIEVRDKFLQKEGMERLADGRLVLLCPNCHCRYDAEHNAKPDKDCSITRKELETRGLLLYEENKRLADKMAAVGEFNHANNGCGRPRYKELSQEAKIPKCLGQVQTLY